jgi:dienelactone hydrolase
MGLSDTSSPVGTWYLRTWYHSDSPSRLLNVTLIVPPSWNLSGAHLLNEVGGREESVDQIRWDASSRRFVFRSHRINNPRGPMTEIWTWFNGTIVEGVLVGRFSQSNTPEEPHFGASLFSNHISGWNADFIDGNSIVPRVYDIILDADYSPGNEGRRFKALLRIDRSSGSTYFLGRMKVYAVQSAMSWDVNGEELEYDLTNINWDGSQLTFTREDSRHRWTQYFEGTTNRNTISGTFAHESSGHQLRLTWNGSRAQILTYGLAPKTSEQRMTWQIRTRRRLLHLMMAGNPVPIAARTSVTSPSDAADTRSWEDPAFRYFRDDDPITHPPHYRIQEVNIEYDIPNPYNRPASVRHIHAWLATPAGMKGKRGVYSAVLALNGHGGSGRRVLQPVTGGGAFLGMDLHYYYGDAFARRNFVVLAIDISHRDNSPSYNDFFTGGDLPSPPDLNVAHPAVIPPGMDNTDWEEDGERCWDVIQGLNFLLQIPQVNPECILVTGISMGGEIAAKVAALDPRIAITISAGWSPDAGVFYHHSPHGCGNWVYADNLEYIDTSDYHSLIATRPLIVMSGKRDSTYSHRDIPYFSGDKTVTRRSRLAYTVQADNGAIDISDRIFFLHYLHYDAHVYHFGDFNPNPPMNYDQRTMRYVQTPRYTAPDEIPVGEDRITWQANEETLSTDKTLFEYIESLDCSSLMHPFPYELYCPKDCNIRSLTDPETLEDPIGWLSDKEDVTVFLNGKVNGLVLSGNSREIMMVTVSPGTISTRYINKTKEHNELNIIESEQGEGFDELEGCLAALQNGEIIKGVILKQNEIAGIISGREEFKEEKAEINNNKPEKT